MSVIHFDKREARLLQTQLQGWSEMNWPGSNAPSDDPSIKGVQQFTDQERGWVLDFLQQIRNVITNPIATVSLADAQQLFIKSWLLMFMSSVAGNYIWKGPYGSNILEGDQFPDTTGSANSNFNGQGSFPENQFYTQANIYNSILQKLGAPQYPPSPEYSSSPGGGTLPPGGDNGPGF